MNSAWRITVAALLVLAPAVPALACPNCIAAQDKNVQYAFAIASAFMTFLPIGLIGSFVGWLWRRANRIAAEEAAGVIRLPAPPARQRSVG